MTKRVEPQSWRSYEDALRSIVAQHQDVFGLESVERLGYKNLRGILPLSRLGRNKSRSLSVVSSVCSNGTRLQSPFSGSRCDAVVRIGEARGSTHIVPLCGKQQEIGVRIQ